MKEVYVWVDCSLIQNSHVFWLFPFDCSIISNIYKIHYLEMNYYYYYYYRHKH